MIEGSPVGPPNDASQRSARAEDSQLVAAPKPKTKPQLANECLALLNRRLELDNQRREADNRLRLVIARGVFLVVFVWLVGVFALIAWHMLADLNRPSDDVLIALLVTTTVNVLGLLSAVVVYLFPKPAGAVKRRPRRQIADSVRRRTFASSAG